MFNVLENNTYLQDMHFPNKFSLVVKTEKCCKYLRDLPSVILINYMPQNQSGNTVFNAVVKNNIVLFKDFFINFSAFVIDNTQTHTLFVSFF